jgi:ABC-type antimicrobial peptide transport system permease subunit
MNWQSRLEKTVIALNLIGLALGFGTLGILILVKGEQAGESWISGLLGIVVGSLFLLFAFYFCKHTRSGSDRNAGYILKHDLKKSELSSLKKVTI